MIMSHVDCLNVSCIRNGPFRFRCYIQYLPEKVARPVIIVSSYRQLSGDGHSEFWTPVRGRLLRVLLSHLREIQGWGVGLGWGDYGSAGDSTTSKKQSADTCQDSVAILNNSRYCEFCFRIALSSHSVVRPSVVRHNCDMSIYANIYRF